MHKTLVNSLPFLVAVATALAPMRAHADDTTDSFDVTATVLASCSVSAQDLAFGNYDPVAPSPLDAASTLSVTCTNGTPYQVGLSLGDGPSANTTTRYMSQGVETLGYSLFQNAARTTPWGVTLDGDTLSDIGDGDADVIDVYGRIPALQTAPAGAYSDTIVVTVTW